MKKFKVGDRVRVKNCFDGVNLKGKIGTVVKEGKRYDYGVEFDEPIENGHSCDGMGRNYHCRYGYENELELVCDKIVLTSDGKKTIATLYENNKVVKSAEFNCHEYFENLIAELDELGKTEKPKYKEVHRRANAGEYVRLDAEYGNGTGGYGDKEFDRCGIYQVEEIHNSLAKIRSKKNNLLSFYDYEYVVLEGYKPEAEVEKATENPFVPHLGYNGSNYGEIGKETKFVDVVGRKLCVGDVVELFYKDGTSRGNKVIVESKGEQFVMGIKNYCNDKDGSIHGGWKVLKKHSWKDVKNGEEINDIKFVTEEPHKYYNGKLVCVDNGGFPDYFTVGKVYKIVDGVLNPNEGIENHIFKNFKSLDDINEKCSAKFIELKE